MRSERSSMGLFMSRIPATTKPQLASGAQKWIVRGPTGEFKREKSLEVVAKVSVIHLFVRRCLEVSLNLIYYNVSITASLNRRRLDMIIQTAESEPFQFFKPIQFKYVVTHPFLVSQGIK